MAIGKRWSSRYRRSTPAVRGVMLAASSALALICHGRSMIGIGTASVNGCGTGAGANIVRIIFGAIRRPASGPTV